MRWNERTLHSVLDWNIMAFKGTSALVSSCLFAGLRNVWIKIKQHLFPLKKKIEPTPKKKKSCRPSCSWQHHIITYWHAWSWEHFSHLCTASIWIMGIKGWNMFGAMILQSILNAFYSGAWPWSASRDYSFHQYCFHFLPWDSNRNVKEVSVWSVSAKAHGKLVFFFWIKPAKA